MSGKAAPNRRVAAIQAKKKRKNPKRKGKILDQRLCRILAFCFLVLFSYNLNKSFLVNSVAGLDSRFCDRKF
jgi:hypothetical protein